MFLFISFLLTWPEWVSFSLVHCIALRNVVELRQPTKLLPNSVIVEEGSHGIIYIPNQALRETKELGKQCQSEEETVQRLIQ